MNDFSEYQQQLQAQRMMEMQQARMQQLQHMQQNAMLFGQQRASLAAATTPLGTIGGGLLGGGIGMGAGGTARQSFLGLAASATGDASILLGIGSDRGLFGSGIGNRLNFRFSDPGRGMAALRSQQTLEGISGQMVPGLAADALNAVGLGFATRRLGLAGQGSVIEDSLGVMNSFSGIRGASQQNMRAGQLGVNRDFAVSTLANLRRGISSRFSALDDDEVRTLSTAAMDSLSLGQRQAMAQGTREDADKALMDQVDLLKKISENTKMSMVELGELTKVAKGQTVGSPSQLADKAANFASSMSASTDMTRGELGAMALGFRRNALDLGATGAGADRMMGSMFRSFEQTMDRFNNGRIDDGVMFAYGGNTPEEAARLRAIAQARQGAAFSRATRGTMGLLDDPIAAMRGGMAGFVGAQAQAIGADPLNAAASAIYSDRGIARGDARMAASQSAAVAYGDMINRQMGGRLNEASLIQLYAQQLNLDDPRIARDEYRTTLRNADELRSRFGSAYDSVASSMSSSDAMTLLKFNKTTGHDGTQGILSRLQGGASFKDAMKAEFALGSGDLRRGVASSLGDMRAENLLAELPDNVRQRVREKLGKGRSTVDTYDLDSIGGRAIRTGSTVTYQNVSEYLSDVDRVKEGDRAEIDKALMRLSKLNLDVVNADTAPDGSVGRELHVTVSNFPQD